MVYKKKTKKRRETKKRQKIYRKNTKRKFRGGAERVNVYELLKGLPLNDKFNEYATKAGIIFYSFESSDAYTIDEIEQMLQFDVKEFFIDKEKEKYLVYADLLKEYTPDQIIEHVEEINKIINTYKDKTIKELLKMLDINERKKEEYEAQMDERKQDVSVSDINKKIYNIKTAIISRKYFDRNKNILSALNNLLGDNKFNNSHLTKFYSDCSDKCSEESFLKSLNLHDYEITYNTMDENSIQREITEKEGFFKFNKEWKMLYYKDDHWVAVCRYPGDEHVYEYDQEVKMYNNYYSFFDSQYNVRIKNFYLVEKKSRFRNLIRKFKPS